ncbi:MAG TPA: CHASE3 domain-containing protein, partial [Hyphomicrobiaceae bacterium]|nr:CHASE3 domain-containing protein [Hyphomicrobiaceae bacterium]
MPFFRLREWRSVVVPLAIGFLLLMGVIAATAWFGAQRGTANAAVQRVLDVELQLSGILSLMQDAETSQRGYLLTGDEAYLQPYEAARRSIAGEMDELRTLMAGSPGQSDHLAALKKIIDDKFVELVSVIDRRRAGATGEALALVSEGTGKRLMDRLRAILGEMRAVQGG